MKLYLKLKFMKRSIKIKDHKYFNDTSTHLFKLSPRNKVKLVRGKNYSSKSFNFMNHNQKIKAWFK